MVYRDGVGINYTVVLDGNPTLIKDLPPKPYDLYHQEKTPSKNQRFFSVPPCRLSPTILFVRSHDLTGDKEEFLAEIPQILLPARAREVSL